MVRAGDYMINHETAASHLEAVEARPAAAPARVRFSGDIGGSWLLSP